MQDPSIIIFDEPTRGVDVGTIPEIHAQIRRLAEEGKAVVVISSYLPEILAISDRILVARLGRIVAEFDARPRPRTRSCTRRFIDADPPTTERNGPAWPPSRPPRRQSRHPGGVA